jgi:hypothetical protein
MAGLFQQDRRAIGAYFGSQPVEAIYFGRLRMWPMDRLEAGAGAFVITGQGENYIRALFMRVPAARHFTITGRTMTVKLGSIMDAEAGSLVITYRDAGTFKSARLHAQVGAFSIGAQAAFIRDLLFPVAAGALAISGKDTSLERHLKMPAGAGAFIITGVDPILSRDLIMAVEKGVFTTAFPATPMKRRVKMPAAKGSYTITGGSVDYVAGPKMPAVPANFVISGQVAGLFAGIRMQAGGIAYTITGRPVETTPSYDRRALAGETGRRRLAGDESGYRRTN